MLRQLELKTGTQGRAQETGRVAAGGSRVIEPDRHIRSERESLLVGKVAGGCVLEVAAENTCTLEVGMIALQHPCNNRIEARDERSKSESRADQSARAGASTACTECGSTGARADLPAESADASARSVLNHTGIYTECGSSRLGTQDIGIGNIQVVTRDSNIKVVLERKRDGIIQ